jgi:hypothetical protein
LTAWAASAAADLARPEGRLFLLALITSIPGTPEVQAEYWAKRDENRGARPSVWSPAPRD